MNTTKQSSNVINTIKQPFNTISKSFSTKQFFESNSIIVKFAFLLLVLLIFVIILKIGIKVLSWTFNKNSPHLIDGMIDATQMTIFSQNSDISNSTTIYKSINENSGIEFTWSVWIYINHLDSSNDKYKNVFYKGNSNLDYVTGLNKTINSPGLYIAPHTNELVVLMNTHDIINNEIRVQDVPMNKWVNVIIRCRNTILDVYINGNIAQSIQLKGVPKQNYGDVFVANNGGFNGNISNLWYYNYALGLIEISNLVKNGPNTKIIGTSTNSTNLQNSNYLQMKWFVNN